MIQLKNGDWIHAKDITGVRVHDRKIWPDKSVDGPRWLVVVERLTISRDMFHSIEFDSIEDARAYRDEVALMQNQKEHSA